MSLPTVAVDVTQFFRDPYASGIQRCIWALAAKWPADLARGLFVHSFDDEYSVLEPSEAAAIVERVFADRSSSVRWRDVITTASKSQRAFRVAPEALLDQVDAWLLPEVTYDSHVLHALDAAATRVPTAMVFFDAFPEIRPDAYPWGPGSAIVSRYFRRAAVSPLTISISAYSNQILHDRLGRSAELTSLVANPGGDHALIKTSPTPSAPTFAVVSTIEARKRHETVIDAFVRVHPDLPGARLILAGRASGTSRTALDKIDAALDAGVPIEWIDAPSDGDVERIYATSTAVFSVGDEGYGIPVLEALRQGCPVAYAGIQPAADICEGHGAVRLRDASVEAVSDFMRSMADFSAARSLRESVGPDYIPAWAEFARDVVAPLVDNARARRVLIGL